MANAVLGDVAVTLEGETFTLRLDMNAYCELEAETGRPASDVIAAVANPERRMVSDQRALAWAALQRHHRGVTLPEVGDLITRDPRAFWDALGRALGASIPQDAPAAGDGRGNAMPGGAQAATD